MQTLEAIDARRSIRRFKTDPVDRETVERILGAA
jgi:nitroreductase